MDLETVARRWADTWSRAWPLRDADAIVALYADAVVHRSTAFRQPGLGLAGIRRYLDDNFAVEENIQCWFGPPIVTGGRPDPVVGQLDRGRPGTHVRGSDRAALRQPRPGSRAPRLRRPRRAAPATLRRLVTRLAKPIDATSYPWDSWERHDGSSSPGAPRSAPPRQWRRAERLHD